jgi:hypothetical protein
VTEEGGRLLLTVGGPTIQDSEVSLTALVQNPQPDEKLTLTVPRGFQLTEGAAEQAVPPLATGAARPISTVSWRVRAGRVGSFTLRVHSSTGTTQKQPLRISPPQRGVLD